MIKEERLKRRSHKLLLIILKFIPMVTALCYMLNSVFAYFGIDASILSQASGMSLLSWLFILTATFVFKFCIYHRMFLYYILASDLINIIDFYWGIPVATHTIIMIQFILAGIFLFLILYTYVKCNKKVIGKTY